MRIDSLTKSLLLLAVSVSSGCQVISIDGGQSGTDANGSTACDIQSSLAVDGEDDWIGLPLQEHVARLDSEWLLAPESDPFGGDHSLALEVELLGEGVRTESDICGAMVNVPVEVTLSLSGVLGAVIARTDLILGAGGGGNLFLQFERRDLLDPDAFPDERDAGFVSVRLVVTDTLHEPATVHVQWGTDAVTYEPSYVPPMPHVPLPEVEQICTNEEETASGNFADAEAALAGVVGSWALCGGEEQWPFAGVQINADRTWRAIVGEGELHIGGGLGAEGSVELMDASQMNGRPGFYQLNLNGLSWRFPAGLIDVSESGNTLQMSESRLVRIEASVPEPEGNPFSEGERAGGAGCDVTESGVQSFATSPEDVLQSLAGRWLGCSGTIAELEIDTQGALTFYDADGNVERALTYEVNSADGNVARLAVGGVEEWTVVLSSAPQKLWIRTNAPENVDLGRFVNGPDYEFWELSALGR